MDQEHTMHQVPAEFAHMQCTVSESLYSRLGFKIHSLMFPHPHSSCTFFFLIADTAIMNRHGNTLITFIIISNVYYLFH